MPVPSTAVWVYKESGTDELKYSIRSAVKNLGIDKVVLIGDKPSWFQETEQSIWIPFKPKRDGSWTRAYVPWQYLDKMLSEIHLEEDFLYFNDDFFVLQPIEDWIDYYRDQNNYNEKVSLHNRVYHLRDMRSLFLLKQTDERHYNLHIPIKLNVNNLISAIDFWKKSNIKDFAFRTFYGNKYVKDALPMADVKYSPNDLFASSGDVWWNLNKNEYKDRFPDKTFAER